MKRRALAPDKKERGPVPVLSWEQPERELPPQVWAQMTADGAPPGVYRPNMSREDQLRWKAKLTQTRSGHPQVEIRKSVGDAQMLVIVALDGWKYGRTESRDAPWKPTRGKNVRISLNGPAHLTFADLADLTDAVDEARQLLHTLTGR